ncbi:MAG: hypothetical protein H6739_06785 [Alphaproteobacteria bacterium]|nr:hypothetical protein [Alphaproteobacteria bacterium]
MTTRTLAFSLLASSLALTTGCGFVSGSLVGAMLNGGTVIEPFVDGVGVMGGTSVVCLGSDAPVSDAQKAEGLYQVEGRIRETRSIDLVDDPDFDNLVPCWTEPGQIFQVVDDEGNTWTVGYSWIAADGWDSTPWVYTWDSDRVELLVRADTTQGSEAAGFAVLEEGELLYVMESGRNGRGLVDGDVDGLSFGNGDVIATTSDDCGDRAALTQEFVSPDDSLTLYPGEDQGMEVEGTYMTTCSIDSWERADEGGCDDPLVNESSFVMFR